jgi:hypothetical protein
MKPNASKPLAMANRLGDIRVMTPSSPRSASPIKSAWQGQCAGVNSHNRVPAVVCGKVLHHV